MPKGSGRGASAVRRHLRDGSRRPSTLAENWKENYAAADDEIRDCSTRAFFKKIWIDEPKSITLRAS